MSPTQRTRYTILVLYNKGGAGQHNPVKARVSQLFLRHPYLGECRQAAFPEHGEAQMPLPTLYTLKEAAQAFGTAGVSVAALRNEVQLGRLRAIRTSNSCNAKILIREDELLRWLGDEASRRQLVPSPKDARPESKSPVACPR